MHCNLLRTGSASQLNAKHHTHALPLLRLPFSLLAPHCFEDGICHLSTLPSKSLWAEATAPHICHGPLQHHRKKCVGIFLCKNNFNDFIWISWKKWACQSTVPVKEGYRGFGTIGIEAPTLMHSTKLHTKEVQPGQAPEVSTKLWPALKVPFRASRKIINWLQGRWS